MVSDVIMLGVVMLNVVTPFRYIEGSEEGPVVVAVNVGNDEVTVDIGSLNPTLDERPVVDVRSVGSGNPATLPG
jgi:hypothetical protein